MSSRRVPANNRTGPGQSRASIGGFVGAGIVVAQGPGGAIKNGSTSRGILQPDGPKKQVWLWSLRPRRSRWHPKAAQTAVPRSARRSVSGSAQLPRQARCFAAQRPVTLLSPTGSAFGRLQLRRRTAALLNKGPVHNRSLERPHQIGSSTKEPRLMPTPVPVRRLHRLQRARARAKGRGRGESACINTRSSTGSCVPQGSRCWLLCCSSRSAFAASFVARIPFFPQAWSGLCLHRVGATPVVDVGS